MSEGVGHHIPLRPTPFPTLQMVSYASHYPVAFCHAVTFVSKNFSHLVLPNSFLFFPYSAISVLNSNFVGKIILSTSLKKVLLLYTLITTYIFLLKHSFQRKNILILHLIITLLTDILEVHSFLL